MLAGDDTFDHQARVANVVGEAPDDTGTAVSRLQLPLLPMHLHRVKITVEQLVQVRVFGSEAQSSELLARRLRVTETVCLRPSHVAIVDVKSHLVRERVRREQFVH